MTTVLEVVELGVSGTKSVGKPGEPIKMKDEKELKPASMRVRDAADALLTILLEQVCSKRYLNLRQCELIWKRQETCKNIILIYYSFNIILKVSILPFS